MALPGLDLPHAALDDALLRDARFLSDARLLAALHGELRRRLGADGAAAVLLQSGFVHGMRDAQRASFDHGPRGAASGVGLAPSLLAFQLRSAPDALGAVLCGSWPQRTEAEAVMIACGSGDAACCLASMGYTSGWLSALADSDILAFERRCAAGGHAACDFEARDASSWRATGDAAAIARLDTIPFAALREIAERSRSEAPASTDAFDADSPAVHVWGPVMVVPYAGEETAYAVECVARDPGASGVSVVVIDLAGVIVDDGFGAVALERVVDVIRCWGAEAVITGLSPLSERVVAGLAGDPIIATKDLRTTIAMAFQIAESQRRAL